MEPLLGKRWQIIFEFDVVDENFIVIVEHEFIGVGGHREHLIIGLVEECIVVGHIAHDSNLRVCSQVPNVDALLVGRGEKVQTGQ